MLGLMMGEPLPITPASIADERSVRLTPYPLSAEKLSSGMRSVAGRGKGWGWRTTASIPYPRGAAEMGRQADGLPDAAGLRNSGTRH